MPQLPIERGWLVEAPTVAEISAFLQLIQPQRRFVLTTHVSPDGDGLGSQLGLAWLIREHGAQARIINPDPVPTRLTFLDPQSQVELFDPAGHRPALLEADYVVMLDNGEPQRMGALKPIVDESPARRICVDHHPEPADYWQQLVSRVDASSTGEIVCDIIEAASLNPPAAIATALFVAISSDTGRFRFANTTATALACAARLVEAGAKPAEIYARLEQGLSREYCRLLAHALSTLSFLANGRVTIVTIPLGAPGSSGVDGEDYSRIVNEALSIEGCRVAALLRSLSPTETKLSLRSIGAIDVHRLAKRHGGGGHRNASGATVALPIDAALEKLKPELEQIVGGS